MTDMTAEQAITELVEIAGSVAQDNAPHMDYIAMLADKALSALRLPEVWREELSKIRDLIASSDVNSLGTGSSVDSAPWPIRDEVVHAITKILSTAHVPDHIAEAGKMAAPAVQGEPVAWYLPGEGGYDSQFRDHATVKSCTGNPWEGWQPLYTTPQPAEQQPAPDVSVLVEALRSILGWRELRSGPEFPVERVEDIARAALAAHRKGSVQQWQPIGTCPRHVDVLFYREDAGVFPGKFTDADSFMTDKERDEWVGTEEEMFDLGAWSYEPEGVYRMDGDLVPTHWMPLPAPPTTNKETNHD